MSQPKKPEYLPDLAEIASKYELDLSRGILKSDGAEDHARMMEAIATYKAMHGAAPPLQEAMNLDRSPRIMTKSMRFSETSAAYLDEKKHQNAAQTLVEKGRTYKDFMALFGDLEINLISKAEIVQWKTNALKRMGANRLNKRLGQVNDFFNWAINHGHYTAHPTSPVESLFIKGTGKLSPKTEHYEPFSNDDLKTIVSSAYPVDMAKPDH